MSLFDGKFCEQDDEDEQNEATMTNTPMTFEEWWESDGQYVRSGGGDYEKSFAYEAWQQNQAVIADLTAKLEWWRELFPSITPKAAIEYQTVYDKADKAEAVIAELVEALEDARQTIRAWHGPIEWKIYDTQSPEMKRLNGAIAKYKG